MKLLFVILVFLFVLPVASASTLFIEFDINLASVNYVGVQELNDYNYDLFYDGDYVTTGIQVLIYLDNILILESELQPTMYVPYSGEQTLRLNYEFDGLELEQEIVLCDLDGVCESCQNFACVMAETSLSCSDCAPSSLDSYCDLSVDGVCDPDCKLYDSDCETSLEDPLLEEAVITKEIYFPDEVVLTNPDELENDNNISDSQIIIEINETNTLENNSYVLNNSDTQTKEDLDTTIIPLNPIYIDENDAVESDFQNYLLYLGVGLFVLLILYILIHSLAKHHGEKQQVAVAYSYVILLRKQNYSDQQIKQFFLEKGYEEEFINKVLKTQDSNP